MTDQQQPSKLRPAETAEPEQALAHALQFDGREQFRESGEMMARITAAHLMEQLGRAGFVVLKKPPAPGHTAPVLEARTTSDKPSCGRA